MDESVWEDLMPFVLMFAGMVVMGGIWLYWTIRRATGPERYEISSHDRNEETSAGYGSYFQG